MIVPIFLNSIIDIGCSQILTVLIISKNWKPHKNKIFDPNQARNGGMIFSE